MTSSRQGGKGRLRVQAKLLGEFLRLEVGVAGQLLSVQDMEDEALGGRGRVP